ncbi:MAG: DUF1704 domain-containing protein, partial [Deltaproteobacteria bacterium]|nr:DUF1704 domain-containing protein [Deltaproteobacteria bacterium]
NRLRTLAARTIAGHRLCEGATFPEVFTQMREKYRFPEQDAFFICERAFRGGGYTKDSIYQIGFTKVFNAWLKGASMTHLMAGKFHLHHLPLVHRFAQKGWLNPPAVIPPFLSNLNRLEADRHVINILSKSEYLHEQAGLLAKA